MIKKLLSIVLLLFLSSCQPPSNTGADGYKFGEPQYEKTEVQIKLVTYKSKSELLAVAKTYGVVDENLAAFSIIKFPFDVCTIHMLHPRVRYEPEFTGHEFLHCTFGQWHTNNGERS
jgi:hypothetical protein